MNQYLKYFIYFLLGVIIYYFLFNSTGGRKVIEGFMPAADIVNYFNNKRISIYIKNTKTGIEKDTDGEYQIKDATTIIIPGSTSTINYSDLTLQGLDDIGQSDIGYTFRPDIYKIHTTIDALTGYFDEYNGLSPYTGIPKFQPLKLNLTNIDSPGKIKIIVSDSFKDAIESPSPPSPIVLNIGTNSELGDVLDLMDNPPDPSNVILYIEKTRDINGAAAPIDVGDAPLKMLIEFLVNNDGNGTNLFGNVKVHFMNIVKQLDIQERLVEFVAEDFVGTLPDSLPDSFKTNFGETESGLKFTSKSITDDEDEATTIFTLPAMNFKDVYNYIDQSDQDIKYLNFPIQNLISETEFTSLQENQSYLNLQEEKANSIVAFLQKSFSIRVKIYNDGIDDDAPTTNIAVTVMDNVDEMFHNTNTDLDVDGIAPTTAVQLILKDDDEATNPPNSVNTSVPLNLFIILKLIAADSAAKDRAVSGAVGGLVDLIGNLESALLLTMRSIGTTPEGTISSNVGCKAAGASTICDKFNTYPAYKYEKYIEKGGDTSLDEDFKGCNPHEPGNPAGWQLSGTSGVNCHTDPTTCCVSTQCSNILSDPGHSEYCSSKNLHNNPYGACPALGVENGAITSTVITTCEKLCCAGPIHSAITDLFYNINNFNFNNNVLAGGGSRAIISRKHIRNFMYGELIRSINVREDTDSQPGPVRNPQQELDKNDLARADIEDKTPWPGSSESDANALNPRRVIKDTKQYNGISDIIAVQAEADPPFSDVSQFLGRDGFEEISTYFKSILNVRMKFRIPSDDELHEYNKPRDGVGPTDGDRLEPATSILMLKDLEAGGGAWNPYGIYNILQSITLTLDTDNTAPMTSFLTSSSEGGGQTYENKFESLFVSENLAGRVGTALAAGSGTDVTLDIIKAKYINFMTNWGKSIPYKYRTMENEIKLSLILLDTNMPSEIAGTSGMTPLKMAFSEETYNTSTFAILL